ncbi:efflux RND transporter periplasmic adaptor subunit [Massilia sp. W12]|uniref:efflux RND transporter periplasmic adaptor subunit n=1 Tax=Massilia sp. W12 TaxID=3126507 RepID=UPI0030D18E6F
MTSGLLAALLGLSACSKPVEKTEDVRPVRIMTLAQSHIESSFEFAGEVKARIESRQGFRVGGKVAKRLVEVGQVVKRGQPLLQLDPQDLQLAREGAQAAMRAAQSNRDLAQAERRRYQELFDKNFVSKAVLDAKDTAYKAAQASLEQAQAGLQAQSNQTNYATLSADMDGVVMALDAEVGQVVAPGAPVLRIAQMGEREVQIGVPEDKLDLIAKSQDVQVRFWANQKTLLRGKLRELSPVADPATRTYAAKVTILDAPPEVKLGMTAYVSFGNKLAQRMIRVPLSALYQEKGITSVWVVQGDSVKLIPVKVAAPSGNEMLLSDGVKEGMQVVTAGVHLLKPGQKVKILPQAAVAPVQAADLEPMGSREIASSATAAASQTGAAK